VRADAVRHEVFRLVRQTPFRPFVLSMGNGERVPVGHPENIAFDPPDNGNSGSDDFYVLARGLRLYGTFEAVTGVALAAQKGRARS
jgi:hypothetical protein